MKVTDDAQEDFDPVDNVTNDVSPMEDDGKPAATAAVVSMETVSLKDAQGFLLFWKVCLN